MNRRMFIISLTAALAAPVSSSASTLEQQIVEQLKDQGYSRISISRTLLGRTRFLATSNRYRREIILNPRTGEILRDLWETLEGGAGQGGARIFDQGSSGNSAGSSGSGGGFDDDDDDDDEDDDDDDDDDDDRDDDDRDDDDDDDDDDRSGSNSGRH